MPEGFWSSRVSRLGHHSWIERNYKSLEYMPDCKYKSLCTLNADFGPKRTVIGGKHPWIGDGLSVKSLFHTKHHKLIQVVDWIKPDAALALTTFHVAPMEGLPWLLNSACPSQIQSSLLEGGWSVAGSDELGSLMVPYSTVEDVEALFQSACTSRERTRGAAAPLLWSWNTRSPAVRSMIQSGNLNNKSPNEHFPMIPSRNVGLCVNDCQWISVCLWLQVQDDLCQPKTCRKSMISSHIWRLLQSNYCSQWVVDRISCPGCSGVWALVKSEGNDVLQELAHSTLDHPNMKCPWAPESFNGLWSCSRIEHLAHPGPSTTGSFPLLFLVAHLNCLQRKNETEYESAFRSRHHQTFCPSWTAPVPQRLRKG